MPTQPQPRVFLPYITQSMGSDPELFFNKRTLMGKRGKVIGAEKIIPKDGIAIREENMDDWNESKIIIDGVQAEINPHVFTCRQSMGTEIAHIFRKIKEIADKKKVIINLDALVKVTPSEMASLNPENKKFGCEPSMNAYGDHITMPDPEKYLFRSAGGHMHFGVGESAMNIVFEDKIKAVKLLDIIVGNTCVMLDRDKGNVERRKFYGRAGEYRAPKHGLEYRVLSNFWLKNYVLMSMVFGLARIAFGFARNQEIGNELLKSVDEKDIKKAINENNFDLAKENWNKIKVIIEKYATGNHSLNASNIKTFDYFIELGVEKALPEDPITHWTNPNFYAGSGEGFESFLYKLGTKMQAKNKKETNEPAKQK